MPQPQYQPKPPRMYEVNMADVRVLLMEAMQLVDEIDEKEVKADFRDGRTRSENPDAAAAQRMLLRLRDVLMAAAGDTSMIWWALKAFPDPRFEGTTSD